MCQPAGLQTDIVQGVAGYSVRHFLYFCMTPQANHYRIAALAIANTSDLDGVAHTPIDLGATSRIYYTTT